MNETDKLQERDPIADAVSALAWAYVILLLDFYLGRFNVLPNWLGMAIMAGAVKKLAGEKEEIMLLHPLAVGIGVWLGVCSVVYVLLGVRLNFLAVEIVVMALALYFHFQLLTNVADIAEAHGFRHTKQILVLRTVKTLLHTATVLPLDWNGVSIFARCAQGVHLLVAVWICVVMFMLRRHLGWTPPPKTEYPEMPPLDEF